MDNKEAKKQQPSGDWMALSPWTAQLSGCVMILESLLKECSRIEKEIRDPAKRYEAIRALIGVTLCKRDAAYTQAVKEDLQLTARLAAQPPT